MRQEAEERNTKELFQQLRQDDERQAPTFISMWEVTMSRSEKAGPYRLVLRIAAVMVALGLLSAYWLILFKRQASLPTPAPPRHVIAGDPSHAPILVPPPESAAQRLRKRARQSRTPAQSGQSDMVISEWRSPTDFLLRMPGEQWLRTVPQFGGALAGIDTPAPDQKN